MHVMRIVVIKSGKRGRRMHASILFELEHGNREGVGEGSMQTITKYESAFALKLL